MSGRDENITGSAPPMMPGMHPMMGFMPGMYPPEMMPGMGPPMMHGMMPPPPGFPVHEPPIAPGAVHAKDGDKPESDMERFSSSTSFTVSLTHTMRTHTTYSPLSLISTVSISAHGPL